MNLVNKKMLLAIALLLIVIWASFSQLDREKKSITLHGKISPYYSYTLRSFYVAQSDLPFCKTGYLSLFGGVVHKRKFFDYKPKINNNQHSITVPLNEGSSSICNYRLKRIALTYHFGSSNTLFENNSELEYHSNIRAISAYRTTQLLPVLWSQEKSDYHIDFYSHADYDIYLKKEFKKEREHKVLLRDTRKELRLLHKFVISPYVNKYHKFPKESEIDKILSKTNKMLYLKEKQRLKGIEKLQKNITYVHGLPVDEWGNPFAYKIVSAKGTSTFDYVTLFSLGEDGVESKDDISSGIKQGSPDPLYDDNHQIKKTAMDTLKDINLLVSLLTKYQYKYKKVANNDEAKELFKKQSKFNLEPSDSWKRTLSKSDLTYVDDEPVDAWNHPFIYDMTSNKKYPILYSLGEDGVKSADDIKRKMFKLF